MPTAQLFIVMASISGFLAVVLGAFGAHGLKNRLAPDLMDVWHTAVQYQFWHTLVLLGLGILLLQGALLQNFQAKYLVASGWLFAAGIVIFCGSLYILCLSGVRWLGAITPVGGVLWLAAWACLCYSAFKSA
ncbi:MAG TPA: DUF423 domain-containing protein [Pseudomonadales bacterium]|nr:DUF423 domain-containing protein [Pseudomonadales bacterium]